MPTATENDTAISPALPTPVDNCACCGTPLESEPRIEGFDRVLGTAKNCSVRVCPECGTGKTFPIAQEDELGAFYEGEYTNHVDVRKDSLLLRILVTPARRFYNWRIRNSMPIAAARGGGRFLDVGCGSGWVAEMFANEGWQAEGIELTEIGCEETAARGVTAHQGTINSVDLPAESFDTILFFHCLEHTVDPRNDLRRAIGLLKPGGQMLVAVPNFSSWEARHYGTYWNALELPRHRTHFTEDGLGRLLESEGLTITKRSTGTPLVSLANSIRNKRTGESRPMGRVGSLLFVAVSIPLMPFSAIIGRLRGGCAVQNVAAVKPAG